MPWLRRLFRVLSLVIVFAVGAWAAPPAAAQDTMAIVGGTVIDPAGERTISDATVIIRGSEIEAVGPSSEVEIPVGSRRIDADGRYVLPGLIDGHVHFFQSGGLYTRPDVIDLRAARPHAEERRLIRERLPDTFRRYLRSGITSVVDVGGPFWNLEVRAKADSIGPAPTVVTAGPLISSVSRPSLGDDDLPILQINSPEAAREEVREQAEAGVDMIKIWYIVGGGETPAAYRPVVEATVDEAHAAGLRVAVHATELETARAAVEAGADILVHSVANEPVDEDFLDLLKERDVLYTPTIMVLERYSEVFAQQLDLTVAEHRLGQKDVIASLFDLQTLPDSLVSRRLRQRIASAPTVPSDTTAIRNLKRVHDAGISVVAGTDAGNIGTPHGPALVREFELMREAGLTPREILSTATAGGARLMGRDDLGRVAEGYQADLLVLESNPLDDLHSVTDLYRVVKEGRVYGPSELLTLSPEEVVQQQANAYNARDLEGFLDAYAEDAALYRGDSLIARGTDALRERYSRRFESRRLHVEMKGTLSLGRAVFARERVTGMAGRSGPVEALVTYRVNTDGKIERVTFAEVVETESR